VPFAEKRAVERSTLPQNLAAKFSNPFVGELAVFQMRNLDRSGDIFLSAE
jgi:hypothetical protein